MRKKLTCILSALVLSWLSLPAWAQIQPMPDPTQAPFPTPIEAGKPAETPPPTVNGAGIAPTEIMPPVNVDSCPAANCGEQPQRPSYWAGVFAGGGGGAYLFPYFSSNPAFFTSSTPGGHTVNGQNNFSTTGNGAPTAFASYTLTSGLGIQSNWLSFHGNNSTSATLDGATSLSDAGGNALSTPSKGSVASANSELNILMVNLEITQKWVFGNCLWLRIGGGVEYAHVDQNYQLSVLDKVNGNSLVNANHGYTGWGPTVSFEIHRGLFDTEFGRFGVYGTARGSLLFGTQDQNYQVTSANPAVAQTLGSTNSSFIVPVGELELGGEWSYSWGRCKVFGQIGVTGQIWGGGGNASSGASLGGNFANQSNSPASFGLIGGIGRVGVEF
jgi:hypothetical protein